jgi:uncharacterized protein (TIGR02466 family)
MGNSMIPIFSTGISMYKLDNINNAELKDYVLKNPNVNKPKKNIKDILNNVLFTKLNKFIKQKMNDHYHEIYNDRYNIELSEAWSNYGNDDSITIPHIHAATFLSAVYYPQAEDGEILFLNPMTGLLSKQRRNMIDQHNPYTSEYYSVAARTGDLIIFSSMLMHFIRCPQQSNRISIAYNGIIK